MGVSMQTLKNRAEWLENRKNGIGGSEISAVIGKNRWMTNQRLWEIKTGRREPDDISAKPYVQYGAQAERHLRGLFRLDNPHYTVEYLDNNSWTNTKFPWALASLDGWMTDQSGRTGVLEIKTVNICSGAQRRHWIDECIPVEYYCQMLFYMSVINADFAVMYAKLRELNGDSTIKQIKIEREAVNDDCMYLMESGAKFWDAVQRDKCPDLILPEV